MRIGAKLMTEPTCEFYGCTRPQMPDQTGTGMRFCYKHDAELRALVSASPFSPGSVLRFWVMANGGAERLAESID